MAVQQRVVAGQTVHASTSISFRRIAWLALPGAILLLAVGLRMARLEYQSLWYDEGSSVFLSRQSLPAITIGTASDIHPPLYYYLLHFWMAVAGQGEYAIRSLSVATGLLMVALLFALGRRLFGLQAGLLSAFVGAISPLGVYYSQETRMYAQVTMFGLLATYLLVRALQSGSVATVATADSRASAARGVGRVGFKPVPTFERDVLRHLALGTRHSSWLWAAYAVAMVACLYSQYVGAFVLLFHGLYVLLHRRGIGRFALAGGAAAVLYLPWLYVARTALTIWPSTSAFHAGLQLFADAAFRYVLGLSAPLSPVTVAATVVVVMVAGASFLLALGKRNPRTPSSHSSPTGAGDELMILLLYLLVPLAAMFVLGYRKPMYNPKFALVALPGFVLLVGLGVTRLGRLKWLGLAVLTVAAGFSLVNYYFDPHYARDDYRAVARLITTAGHPGDAVILDAPGQEQVFPYYYHGPLPVIGLPADRPLVPDKTSAQLDQLNRQHRRLWLVLYGTNGSDPDSYVEHWLASKDYEIENRWFGDVRLVAFSVPLAARPPDRPVAVTLGGFARLKAYGLNPDPVPSGGVLQLGLRWLASGPGPGNEKVFTHVIDAEGNIWAQRDSDPVGGARPTGSWKPGETIDDNYGLLVLPGTPPGDYQVEVGMYAPADGRRLAVTAGGSGDRVVLAGLHVSPPVQPPSADELKIPHPLDVSAGALRLLGYGLTLVGQDVERSQFRAGDTAHLTLFWQADRAPGRDLPVEIDLRPASGQSSRQALVNRLLVPQHPTSSWQQGERYRDQYRLHFPAGSTGDFDLVVRLGGIEYGKLARIHLS